VAGPFRVQQEQESTWRLQTALAPRLVDQESEEQAAFERSRLGTPTLDYRYDREIRGVQVVGDGKCPLDRQVQHSSKGAALIR
jgi:hypothetical protein